MPIRPMNRLVDHLRRAAAQSAGEPLTDGDLLERFVTERDGPRAWGRIGFQPVRIRPDRLEAYPTPRSRLNDRAYVPILPPLRNSAPGLSRHFR